MALIVAILSEEVIMPYHFNIKNHYKIWLSPNPNQFLPIRNQLRLIHEIQTNAGVEMRFVYSQACLNDFALDEMRKFCLTHKIIPIAFESLLPLLTKEREREVAAIASQEIEHFRQNTGGNLAAASDCIRLLSVVIETCGIYSDSDVRNTLMQFISNQGSDTSWVDLQGPLLFFGFQIPTRDEIIFMCNNDFLAFSLQGQSHPEPNRLSIEASQCVENLQRVILDNYSRNLTMSKFFDLIDSVIKLLEKGAALDSPVCQFIASMKQDNTPRTLFALRKHLQDLMTCHSDKLVQQFLYECLKQTVTRFSGPEIYPNLFAHLVPARAMKSTMKNDKNHSEFLGSFLRSSIGYYDSIFDNIKSQNEANLVLERLTTGHKPGGDLSWMPDGHKKMVSDDERLNQYASHVLHFWREKRPTKLIGAGAERILAVPALLGAVKDKRYALALRKAVVGGEAAVVKCLLDCRQKRIIDFNINESSSNGNTALDWAIMTDAISADVKEIMIDALQTAGAQTFNASIEGVGLTLSS